LKSEDELYPNLKKKKTGLKDKHEDFKKKKRKKKVKIAIASTGKSPY